EPAVRERLEDLRSGGLERDARDAEASPLIDTGQTLPSPATGEPLPVLISPGVNGRCGATAGLGIPARDRTDALIAARLSLPVNDLTSGERSTDMGAGDIGAGDIGARDMGAGDIAAGDIGARDMGAGDIDASAVLNSSADVASTDDGGGGISPIVGVRPAVRYRANDFTISRQRSWGTPIPIVYCEGGCGIVPVPLEQLPVLLPLDLKPTGAGNPLAEREDFVQTTCPSCDGPARRETDTLDCHFDALWLWVPVCVPPAERERPLDEIFALED